MSKRQTYLLYYHNTAEHADKFLLEATNKTELTESGYASNPSGCSSTDESVDDDEACDSLDIPLDLLTEATDLSRLCGDDALQTFQDVFSRKESLLSFDYEFSEKPFIHTCSRTPSTLLLFSSACCPLRP